MLTRLLATQLWAVCPSVPQAYHTYHCASRYSSRVTRIRWYCSTHTTTHTPQAWAALLMDTHHPPLHPHPCNFSPPPLFMLLPFTAWGQQGYPVSKLLACPLLTPPCPPPTLRPLPMVPMQPERLCYPSGSPALPRLRFETLMHRRFITQQPSLTPPAGLQHRVRAHLSPFPSPPSRPPRHPLSSTPITLSHTFLSYVYNLPLDWTDEQVSRVDLPLPPQSRCCVGADAGAAENAGSEHRGDRARDGVREQGDWYQQGCERLAFCFARHASHVTRHLPQFTRLSFLGYGFIVFEDPKYVSQALHAICSTQVAPDHFLSAQMSHASMRCLTLVLLPRAPRACLRPACSMFSSSFPSPAIPLGFAPNHSLSSGHRGRYVLPHPPPPPPPPPLHLPPFQHISCHVSPCFRGGRSRGRGDWAARGSRQPRAPGGGDDAAGGETRE